MEIMFHVRGSTQRASASTTVAGYANSRKDDGAKLAPNRRGRKAAVQDRPKKPRTRSLFSGLLEKFKKCQEKFKKCQEVRRLSKFIIGSLALKTSHL